MRPPKLYERTIYEKVEYALEQKAQATTYFQQHDYDKALERYATAIEAVKYTQHSTQSDNVVRADLLLVLITCSNNAATCATHVPGQAKSALQLAQNADRLLQALHDKGSTSKVRKVLAESPHNLSDTKLFGQFRIKSCLLQAKAQIQLHNADEALVQCQQAREILLQSQQQQQQNTQDAELAQLVKTTPPQITTLSKKAKELQHQIKQREKKRAQAMFGGGNQKKTSNRNKEASSETTTTTISRPLTNGTTATATSPSSSPTQRRVSFSDTVQQREIAHRDDVEAYQEEDLVWYQDVDFLIGVSLFGGAALVAALGTAALVFRGKK